MRRFVHADHQRADAEDVAERQQAVARDHRHHRICAVTALMHAGHRRKDVFGSRRYCLICSAPCQHIEQHFRIGIGVDVAQIFHEQLLLQFFGIGQVAVMAEHNSEWRIHIEWLRLVVIHRRTGSRITHMRNPRVSGKRTHVAGAEHVAHQTVALVQMKGAPVQRRDTGGILTAMLQDLQAVIQQLIGWRMRNDSENATHDFYPDN